MEHIDEKSVTLSWQRPANDGGGKISGYVIEKLPEGADEWVEVPGGPVKDTTATVPHLKTGEKCRFRVRAVNKAGNGAPSKPTDVIT